MPTAQSTIDVNVPLSTAYNQWTQLETFPHFMSGVESVTQLEDSRTHWVTNIGGVQREFDAHITDQVPDQHMEWHSVGELDQGGRVSFESLDPQTTRVSLTVDWDPQGFAEKAGAAVGVDDALVRGDLERFKSFIEERGVEDGAWRGEIRDAGTSTTGDEPIDPQI
ncbi:SRPBCC family protein [Demequina activiva]|uniref:Cyclase n=1 Tax=Demequina activiva TaxID=1582364 RepID=A0A919UKD0_9MICO|nr:SRPBCC family protein [Demequina activiva]GIG53578.1 cyclase [Demequina activiva]